VARFVDLDWNTVKDLDRGRLERELGPVDLAACSRVTTPSYDGGRSPWFAGR